MVKHETSWLSLDGLIIIIFIFFHRDVSPAISEITKSVELSDH